MGLNARPRTEGEIHDRRTRRVDGIGWHLHSTMMKGLNTQRSDRKKMTVETLS